MTFEHAEIIKIAEEAQAAMLRQVENEYDLMFNQGVVFMFIAICGKIHNANFSKMAEYEKTFTKELAKE